MPRIAQRQTSGMTLIEVIISASMMFMLLTAFYAIAEMLARSQLTTDARITARQNVRNVMRTFGISASETSYFYEGDGNPIVLGGYTCMLPSDVDEDGVYISGDTIAIAVPKDLTRPINSADDPKLAATARYPVDSSDAVPDGYHDNFYDIVVLTSRPTQPNDSRNPDSRQMVLLKWENVVPPIWGAAGTLDLEDDLVGAPLERVFDCYLKPLDEDGFRVNYRSKSGVPAAAYIHIDYRQRPLSGPPQSEDYDFLINTRNIF